MVTKLCAVAKCKSFGLLYGFLGGWSVVKSSFRFVFYTSKETDIVKVERTILNPNSSDGNLEPRGLHWIYAA